MSASKPAGKIECFNPNTGGRMNIDAGIYELFSRVIYHTLMSSEGLSYTQLAQGVKEYFQQQGEVFNGSVSWYTVTIKHDMQAKGIIDVYTEKGKKLHRLAKKETGSKSRRDR